MKQPLTIYVGSQSGTVSPAIDTAGTKVLEVKTLARALQLAKSGSTIVLGSKVYKQNIAITSRSNVRIIGASDQTTVIAPKKGIAIKLTFAKNITIQDVWLRAAGARGVGLSVIGSTASVANIRTNGTQSHGVNLQTFKGRTSSLTASSSHFDGSLIGDGMFVQGGSTVQIDGSTFDNNGNGGNVGQGISGFAMVGNSVATISNSEFNGNANNGLSAHDTARITIQGSTFSSNIKGNGAIFLEDTAVTLTNNTFSSNGRIPGPATGFNGVEFYRSFTGTAQVNGNSFVNNTSSGLFIGGSPNTIQITNNLFDGNYYGVVLDAAEGTTTINAVVQGNTIRVPLGSSPDRLGIVAQGRGLTATIGGAGGLANTIQDYSGPFIYIADGVGTDHSAGFPTLTILTNTFTRNGVAVPPATAIYHV